VTIGGHVFRPGVQGLVGAADVTVSAFICDRRTLCSGGPVDPFATAVTNRSGLFSMSVPARVSPNVLLFSVTLDGVPYRGLLVTGPLPDRALRNGVAEMPFAPIDPISESAFRLLAEAGFENYDDAGVEAILEAVRDANADTVFDGLSVADAADLAEATAADDPDVQRELAERQVTPTPTMTGGPERCTGDCDGDAAVTVAELIRGVNIALGNAPAESCPAFDRNGDDAVAIDELVAAVNAALDGCPPSGSQGHSSTAQ
jgi:hypothetical protein